jgi:HEPN domain-containing protein
VNRYDLRELALIRLKEARTLLGNGQYEGAYYLSGYVVECALKACIAKQTKRYDFPNLRNANKSYTHDMSELVKMADLENDRKARSLADPAFHTRWNVIRGWSEQSRYAKPSRQQAESLYSAISDRKHGVLSWIKQHW